jgi:pimeloyl-ACP methyl ester carboxylesterase
MPKRIVTVHGIDTTGDWQQEVERVFTPHFECVNLKYTHYRRFGAVRLAFGSEWVLFLALIALAVCIAGLFSRSIIIALAAVAWLFAIAVAGIVVARRKRSQQLNEFKIELDARLPFGSSPHLIAHSFGTFLSGNALAKFPNLRFNRVVFAGCVLPRYFGWTNILKLNPNAFAHLRNEIAAKDWIPRVAEFAKFVLLPGFGSAGVWGFWDGAEAVHTIDARRQSMVVART